MTMTANEEHPAKPPLWLRLFCFALMGPAVGINAVFVALATPAAAPYGIGGLIAAGAIGIVLGLVPARWLARKIDEGLREG
jgi:hypothetical protein